VCVIIAIDGPAASGKSTVAKAVARRLGIHYLDTGAMYRALAALALLREVPTDDDDALTALAREFPVSFEYSDGPAIATGVHIAGEDVTRTIRTPEVDTAVSPVSAVPEVRAIMVDQQRALAAKADTVLEGRDIGTVVFPNAEVKVFLTASYDERARRRQIDMTVAGVEIATDEVRERLVSRDRYDSTREASPLEPATDAVQIDTTELTVEEVVDRIAALAEQAR
jgi:cytidylate kinase